MQAQISHNTKLGGIEVKFPTRPTRDTLDALKALGFKWSSGNSVWYAKYSADRLASVETLLDSPVVPDTQTYQRPERLADSKSTRVDLPFEQHLKAYSKYLDLLKEEKDNNVVETFIGTDGTIYFHQTGLWKRYWEAESERKHDAWFQVSKSGKVASWRPGELGYGATEVFQFAPDVYGVRDRKDPEWYRPSDKVGTQKYLSNGKQVAANEAKLNALGLLVEAISSYGRFSVRFRPSAKSGQPKRITAGTTDDLKPFSIPAKLQIPEAKRKPHYNISSFSGYNNAVALRSDVLETEVLLGKMEIAQHKYFDGMDDSTHYIPDEKLQWAIPVGGMPYVSSHYTPKHIGANKISWDDYYLRYTTKPVRAIIDLSADPKAPLAAAPKEVDSVKLSAKFIKTADSLQASSDKKKSELERQQRNTPKKNREWNSKNIEAEMEADKAAFYRAVGQAIQNNSLPEILNGIKPERTADSFYLFVARQSSGGGYYDAYRDSEPPFKAYAGKYDSGHLTREAEKIGLLVDQLPAAYQTLLSLTNGQGSVSDPSKAKLNRLIDDWRFTKQPGFFPTPDTLADELVRRAEILNGDTILEPSAGLGNLAEAIQRRFPNRPVDVVEKWDSLREILQLKGFNVVGDDFLTFNRKYDRIIMNPPFEQGQDIAHVRHAYDLLKAGGRLVAIMSEGSFYRSNAKKDRDFQEWLTEVDSFTIQNEEGAFKSAFKPTGVRTRIVVIDKPGNPDRPKRTAKRAKNASYRKAATTVRSAKSSQLVGPMIRPKRTVVTPSAELPKPVNKAKNSKLRSASTTVKAAKLARKTTAQTKKQTAIDRIAKRRGVDPSTVKVVYDEDTHNYRERRLKVDSTADKLKRAAIKNPAKLATDKPKLTKTERAEIKQKGIQDAETAVSTKKKELTPEQVIKIGKPINFNRYHIVVDGQVYNVREDFDTPTTNKRRLAPTEENLLKWAKKPGRYDLIGVDSAGKYSVTVHKKKDKGKVPARLRVRSVGQGLRRLGRTAKLQTLDDGKTTGLRKGSIKRNSTKRKPRKAK